MYQEARLEFGDLIAGVAGVTEGIIVQQVNAQGVMNSGFAKAVREKYPVVWHAYAQEVGPPLKNSGRDLLGQIITCQVKPDLWVISIIGQQFFGRDGKRYTSYDALDVGFEKVAKFAETQPKNHIHYPAIGCGLGGGRWFIVEAIINEHLGEFQRTLWIPSEEMNSL